MSRREKRWDFDQYDWIQAYDERIRRIQRLHYDETLSRVIEIAAVKEGDLVEFEGTITNIFTSYEGDIHCDSLRSLRYSILFRPIACRFTPSRGDTVKFNIAFNFLNPSAINVQKM